MIYLCSTETMLNRNKKSQIILENVSVVYNQGQSNEVRSLENVYLKLYPQEYVIIFGPSGCGKSTLLYSIAGLQKPTQGKVVIDDNEIYALDKKDMVAFHRKKIGLIFQAFYLIVSLNVIDNICLPRTASGENTRKRKKFAKTLLERFGILNQERKMPGELSGGQKQRVSIARALANNPDIILADEPVGNLDSVSSHNVMQILEELNQKDKKTVILVTHDPSHLKYGDRVIYLKDGKIIKEEIIKKKLSVKDVKIEEISVSEKIPQDLKMLIRAFRDLSLSQTNILLVPFKAQQLFSHVILTKTHEHIDRANKNLEELLFDRCSTKEFIENLDADLEKGGAGWDKRMAEKFAMRVETILKQAKQIDLMKPKESSSGIVYYLAKTFGLKLTNEQIMRFNDLLVLRLKNKLSIKEIQKGIDISFSDGGVGLDKRISMKISQEVEMLLLLNYG
ncbi:MAG: ABC transporter ATP-binding protein [Patescibacteria group bacterium]|nr:ABC transporter ATP-binding protein [Patescibacteria group bacterium]